MLNEFSRMCAILGGDALLKLKNSSVAVFGLGGVGAHTAAALARSGVGKMAIFDGDAVSITNINRQLIASHSTLGMRKTEAMARLLRDINPNIQLEINDVFYTAQNAADYDLSNFSYVADAIDTISSKILIIENCHATKTPVISCMGTGNKLDPTKFEVADISRTSVCPLARVMRRELKKRGIYSLKTVYSKEIPLSTLGEFAESKGTAGRTAPGSVSFVPPVAGLIMAGEIVKDIVMTD